jgi:hypothetical protein
VFPLSQRGGWPLRLDDGRLFFLSLRGDRTFLAGDFNGFAPAAMNIERDSQGGFRYAWLVVAAGDGQGYKFVSSSSNGAFDPDPNARCYGFDGFGELSFTGRTGVNRAAYPQVYERHLGIGRDGLLPRNVRVLLPATTPTHVLYVHDGQNVLRRDSAMPADFVVPFGGWNLDVNTPAGLMIVAIDNTVERFYDYTPVVEPRSTFGGFFSEPTGGGGDLYADFVVNVVRPLIDDTYGEPAVRGVMGSSLGGLVSLEIAARFPDAFHFAAGLSSSFGWGSFENETVDDGDDTLIDDYRGAGVRNTVLYIDSGGNPRTRCADTDGDGIDDDVDGGDNFCETLQMRDVLLDEGYVLDDNLIYRHDGGLDGNGAGHREDAWAFRAATIVMPLFMQQ